MDCPSNLVQLIPSFRVRSKDTDSLLESTLEVQKGGIDRVADPRKGETVRSREVTDGITKKFYIYINTVSRRFSRIH